jgi:hypothetical protein
MGWTKIGLLLLLLVAAAIFFAAGGLEALSFESVKSGQKALQNWMQEEPLLGTLLFVGGYILLTGIIAAWGRDFNPVGWRVVRVLVGAHCGLFRLDPGCNTRYVVLPVLV